MVKKMKRKNIKRWAKEKIQGNIWDILGAYLIANIILWASLMLKTKNDIEFLIIATITIIFNSIFQVGYTTYMINFINDKNHTIKQMFSKFKNYKQIIPTYLYLYLKQLPLISQNIHFV